MKQIRVSSFGGPDATPPTPTRQNVGVKFISSQNDTRYITINEGLEDELTDQFISNNGQIAYRYYGFTGEIKSIKVDANAATNDGAQLYVIGIIVDNETIFDFYSFAVDKSGNDNNFVSYNLNTLPYIGQVDGVQDWVNPESQWQWVKNTVVQDPSGITNKELLFSNVDVDLGPTAGSGNPGYIDIHHNRQSQELKLSFWETLLVIPLLIVMCGLKV